VSVGINASALYSRPLRIAASMSSIVKGWQPFSRSGLGARGTFSLSLSRPAARPPTCPFLNSLPLDDEVPDIPVKLDQFSVKRRSSPNTRPFGNGDLSSTADVARSGRAIPTQLV